MLHVFVEYLDQACHEHEVGHLHPLPHGEEGELDDSMQSCQKNALMRTMMMVSAASMIQHYELLYKYWNWLFE
jgi:hypothetical protein